MSGYHRRNDESLRETGARYWRRDRARTPAEDAARVARDQAFIAPQTRHGIHYRKVSADTFVQSTARIASG